jgi:hypothetical protein
VGILGDPVPAEKHDGKKGGLKKEGEYAFGSQRGAEDIAHHPRIVRPVGAEFKFQDNAGGDADGKVDAEQGHPEFGDPLPFLVAGFDIECFKKGKQEGKPQGERHKDPVIHGRKGKLSPGPVYHRQIEVFNHGILLLFRG